MLKGFATIFLLLLIFTTGFGQTKDSSKRRFKIEPSVEYLAPIHPYRSIQTISGNLLLGVYRNRHFSIYGGFTATYAWGTIIQWDSNFNNITYKNKALGLGPVFLIRYEIFIYKGLSISPDFSGGIILYSSKFPYGGDIYNFMWRLGGAIHYHINKMWEVNINAKWMHVSNGQGLGPWNPSYEAEGIGIGFTRYLLN
jgi:lipid A 3-O-deacylase